VQGKGLRIRLRKLWPPSRHGRFGEPVGYHDGGPRAGPGPEVVPAMRFGLQKWYLDCSEPSGLAAIIYVGQARVGWLPTFHFWETLLRPDSRDTGRPRRVSVRPLVRVVEAPDGLSLQALPETTSGAPRPFGRWAGRRSGLRIVLIDHPALRIEWRCPCPTASVSFRLQDGTTIRGEGYAECLSLAGSLAALPFRELRWGRFVAGARSVVWIDWSRGLTRRWVFVDGRGVDASVVSAESVEWPKGHLTIESGTIIRDGSLSEAVAGPFGRWVRHPLIRGRETKWASLARLEDASGVVDGRVIHEVVRWH